MAFNKKTWVNGQILDADNMNRLETEIDNLSKGNSGSVSPVWEYNIYDDNLGFPVFEEIDIPFTTEFGTLNDDISKIAGDKITSNTRRRMTDMVSVKDAVNVYLSLPDNVGCWINYYDASKQYLKSCTTTLYGDQELDLSDGVCYTWIIFRLAEPVADTPTLDQLNGVRLYATKQVASEELTEPNLLETISVVAKNAYNMDIQVEGGTIDPITGVDSDSIGDYKTKIRSGLLVSIDGATKISFNTYLPKCTSGCIIFYDYNMNVMRAYELNNSYGVMDLQGDEKYFRVVFNVGIPALKTINITVYNAKRPPIEVKKKLWKTDYVFDSITYPVNGNKTICNTLRIFLPPNYSATSPKKVPLIYYLPGSGNWYGWNNPNWPGTNSGLYNGL